MHRMALSFSLLMLLSQGTNAAAQQHHHGSSQHLQPYAGLEKRAVKALSGQDLKDLQQGKGMRLALAAELNGYPGPKHVLEFAEGLDLTAQQHRTMNALVYAMTEEAVAAGAEVINAETQLDALFSSGEADEVRLQEILKRIANHWAELRGTHLRYHLQVKAVLTPKQVNRYNELRGYTSP